MLGVCCVCLEVALFYVCRVCRVCVLCVFCVFELCCECGVYVVFMYVLCVRVW